MAMKCSFCAMPAEKNTQTKTMKYVAIDTRLDNIQRAEVEPKAEARSPFDWAMANALAARMMNLF